MFIEHLLCVGAYSGSGDGSGESDATPGLVQLASRPGANTECADVPSVRGSEQDVGQASRSRLVRGPRGSEWRMDSGGWEGSETGLEAARSRQGLGPGPGSWQMARLLTWGRGWRGVGGPQGPQPGPALGGMGVGEGGGVLRFPEHLPWRPQTLPQPMSAFHGLGEPHGVFAAGPWPSLGRGGSGG